MSNRDKHPLNGIQPLIAEAKDALRQAAERKEMMQRQRKGLNKMAAWAGGVKPANAQEWIKRASLGKVVFQRPLDATQKRVLQSHVADLRRTAKQQQSAHSNLTALSQRLAEVLQTAQQDAVTEQDHSDTFEGVQKIRKVLENTADDVTTLQELKQQIRVLEVLSR